MESLKVNQRRRLPNRNRKTKKIPNQIMIRDFDLSLAGSECVLAFPED